MPNNTIRVLTPAGVQFVEVPDPWERSTIGRHWNAVRDFLENGDPTTLRRLEGELLNSPGSVLVGDVELGFDLDVIEREASRGDVQFESIYE